MIININILWIKEEDLVHIISKSFTGPNLNELSIDSFSKSV